MVPRQEREAAWAGSADRDPFRVPSLFVMRREADGVTTPPPVGTSPLPASGGVREAAAGEDIVLAGPAPLPVQNPDVEWAWMEAAAAAWLAQREAGGDPAAPSAPTDAEVQTPPAGDPSTSGG